MKDSVNIDVDDGNNQGVISAGQHADDTVTVTNSVTETTVSLAEQDKTDENSRSNQNAIIIIAVVVSTLAILVIIYYLVIRPRLEKRKKTKPEDNQLASNHWNQQPSKHILRNL